MDTGQRYDTGEAGRNGRVVIRCSVALAARYRQARMSSGTASLRVPPVREHDEATLDCRTCGSVNVDSPERCL